MTTGNTPTTATAETATTATTKTRRSAGTARNGIDKLLSLLRIRRLTTEKDLADLRAGYRLKVLCMSSTLGTPRMLWIGKGKPKIAQLSSGHLYLRQGAEIVWQNRRTAETVPVRGPFVLTPAVGKPTTLGIGRYELTAAGEKHHVALYEKDVPLVTEVLAAAGS